MITNEDFHADIAEFEREVKRWKANQKAIVETKRGSELRLRVALAALQQIYDVCKDNAAPTCHHHMALDFVRQVAGDAFEKATHNVPRRVWRSADDWLLIETAPKDGTWVLVAASNLYPCDAQWVRVPDLGEGWHDIGGFFATQPTHWMPLPTTP